jgi:hypothetical protein
MPHLPAANRYPLPALLPAVGKMDEDPLLAAAEGNEYYVHTAIFSWGIYTRN